MIILPEIPQGRRTSPWRRQTDVDERVLTNTTLPEPTRRSKHQKETHNIVNNQYMNMIWYARCGMRCICKIWQGVIEPGLNLEIQECHWKDEMKSLENDIKITGIGVTVWKWQAIQIWHRSAIYNKWSSKCNEMNMLQHSNMTTKYMAGMHSRCLRREHWATTNSSINRFKQAWQKCKW